MKEWIIPVIIAIVWILNALLRNRENDDPVRVPRGKLNEGRPNRGPASDIDRFLQEIELVKKRSLPPAEPPRPIPAQVRTVRPVPTSMRAPAPRVKIAQRQVAPTVIAVPHKPAVFAPIAKIPVRDERAIIKTLSILRTPQSTAHAIILGVILGEPKCRLGRRQPH